MRPIDRLNDTFTSALTCAVVAWCSYMRHTRSTSVTASAFSSSEFFSSTAFNPTAADEATLRLSLSLSRWSRLPGISNALPRWFLRRDSPRSRSRATTLHLVGHPQATTSSAGVAVYGARKIPSSRDSHSRRLTGEARVTQKEADGGRIRETWVSSPTTSQPSEPDIRGFFHGSPPVSMIPRANASTHAHTLIRRDHHSRISAVSCGTASPRVYGVRGNESTGTRADVARISVDQQLAFTRSRQRRNRAPTLYPLLKKKKG